MEIEGKKAVVVGGASGFGRATAESLAKRGASIAVLDRPQSKGREVADASVVYTDLGITKGMQYGIDAAHRAGIFEVILPADNQKDLADVPENLRNVMQLHFVNTMDEVLSFALEQPLPQVAEEEAPTIPAIPPASETSPTAHQ